MITRYVVEKIHGTVVTHILAENIREAEQIFCSIPRPDRGSVYPLYTKNILDYNNRQEDEHDTIR